MLGNLQEFIVELGFVFCFDIRQNASKVLH